MFTLIDNIHGGDTAMLFCIKKSNRNNPLVRNTTRTAAIAGFHWTSDRWPKWSEWVIARPAVEREYFDRADILYRSTVLRARESWFKDRDKVPKSLFDTD